MPDPTLQELLQQLQQQAEPSEKHRALLAALQNYDLRTARFRQLRGRKKLPLVTARDKNELLALHRAVGRAAEDVLGDQNEPQALREIVKKITALSSASHNALLRYDPAKEPKTLASLEEDVRTLTIHQGSVVLGGADTLSGAQSERVPLSFLDAKGNRISGVFTKKAVVDPDALVKDAFDRVTGVQLFSVRRDAEATRWLRENFYRTLRSIPRLANELGPDAADGEYLTQLLILCEETDRYGKDYFDPQTLKTYLGAGLAQSGLYDADSLRDDTWRQLAQEMEPMRGPLLYAHQTAKIPFGGRIDNRNAAMSAVADLLGMPSVIARSKPMRIVDKDGKVVEGTFMEASKGLDPKNLSQEVLNVKPDSLENTDGKGFKDIANLQILDYLCGNCDRHSANMRYQFDHNGKLCGVQGIDNDSCFGVLTSKELGKGKQNFIRMTNLFNLKVIPKETRDRVLALDASTLKYALRGYGLSEKELRSAGARLETMQTFIREAARRDLEKNHKKDKKILRVMSDSDFKKASITELTRKSLESFVEDQNRHDLSYANTFNLVEATVPGLIDDYNKQAKEYKDLKDATDVGMDNRAERHVPRLERLRGTMLEAILNKRTWSAWTSQNYINLQRAVKNYVSTHKTIENRLKTANDEETKRRADYHHEKEAVVSEADLERMKNASVQVRDAAWTYLTGKMPDLKEWELDGKQPIPYPQGASDYTKRRIDAAVTAYRVAKLGDELKPVETQTARDNEKEALAAQRRRRRERNPEGILEEPVLGGPAAGG